MGEDAREYVGKSIKVVYFPDRCVHARTCAQSLPEVFDPQRRPWIDPNAACAERIADVIPLCPSGALQFSRRDGGAEEDAPGSNTVRVTTNGPLFVTGEISLFAADGDLISRETRVALCRCGASRHKPFCDGSHQADAFEDPGRVRESREQPPQVSASGALEIGARRDGPYILKGPVTIIGDGGEQSVRREKVALCRCGASANKPFCDGSHKALEFVAD